MKKLSRSERIQRRIYIPSKIRFLLPTSTVIPVTVSDKVIQIKIDSYGYMTPQDITWDRFITLLKLENNDVLVFKQNEDRMLKIYNKK